MSCYHPLKAVHNVSDTGAYSKLRFLKQVEYTNMQRDELIDYFNVNTYELRTRFVEVPCGKCLGCRLDKSKDWAARIMLESLYHKPDRCHFITFTFDPQHLPKIGGIPVIWTKAQFAEFNKRLRDSYKNAYLKRHPECSNKEDYQYRFFANGEYGEEYHRPHHHFIVFNMELDDLYFWKLSKKGEKMYRSPWLEQQWHEAFDSEPLGYVTVQELTYKDAAYVARYTLKKQSKDFYKSYGIVEEWINMSRKPGIGRKYFEQYYKKILANGGVVMPGDHAFVQKPPRYFDRVLDQIDPYTLDKVKEIRQKNAEVAESIKLARIKQSLDRQRLEDEEAKAAQISSLLRNFESGD